MTDDYGYMKDPSDKKKWILDEDAAAVVQFIFSSAMEGLGPSQIGRRLEEKQVLSPGAYWASKGISYPVKVPEKSRYAWCAATISGILSNPAYLGHTVNFKTHKKSYKSKKTIWNDASEWAVFENTHPAIISKETFLRVQELRKNKRRPTRMGDMGMFSGLVKCGNCGSKMYLCRRYGYRDQDYYICSQYRKDRSKCPKSNMIRSAVLEKIVASSILSMIDYVLSNQKSFVHDLMELSQKDMDKEMDRKKKLFQKNESRIDKIDNIIRQLYLDKVAGNLTDERFKKMALDFEKEQAELKEESKYLIQELSSAKEKEMDANKFISLVRKYGDSKELTPEILNSLIDHIEVFPKNKETGQREIVIHYNFIGPYQIK